MPTFRSLAALPVAGLLLASCAGISAPDAPTGAPLVRGPVQSVRHHAAGSGILVAAGPGSQERCGIHATADASTRVFERARSGGLRRATVGTVQVGDTVEVYVDGPVMESCPVQGGASALVIVRP